MTNQPSPNSDHEASQAKIDSAKAGPASDDQNVDATSEANSQSPDVVSELLRLGRFLQKNKPADE
jgi:hypothetical protein